MENTVAVIEIRNRSYKLVIGYLLDNKIDVIYRTTNFLSIPLRGADVLDISSLATDISKIVHIDDHAHKLLLNINEVILVYPSYGLEVYNSIKQTNTISNISKIDKIDIDNAISLVKKEKIPNGNNQLIDVIPNVFLTENGKQYNVPPIGEISSSIRINANVYTLPMKMMSDMKGAVIRAGLAVKREVIAPAAVSYMLAKQNYKYKTYVLIDFGARSTILSFIGDTKLYASTYFNIGGDDLTSLIASKFSISNAEAEEIKKTYGLDLKRTSYNPIVATSTNEEGMKKEFYKEDLSNIVVSYLKSWTDALSTAIKTLLNKYPKLVDTIPLIFIGDASKLSGLKDYMFRFLPNTIIDIYYGNSIGAMEPGYINCLAAIYYSSVYKGSLEDTQKRVSDVGRENEAEEYSETKDTL